MRRLSMKSKKGKGTDHTKADTNDSGSDVKDAVSEAESAGSEDARVSSKPKNKRGKRRGNSTGVEDGGTETKKMRNVGAEEGAETVKYEVSKFALNVPKVLQFTVGHIVHTTPPLKARVIELLWNAYVGDDCYWYVIANEYLLICYVI